MELSTIHSFLVRPGKSDETQQDISGAAVPLTGKLFEMLKPVFVHAETECQHNIAFLPAEDGAQNNECRNALIAYIKNSDVASGRAIAKRLQEVTTRRSGLGLLFLLTGNENGVTKLVVSRFPADSAILAEEKHKTLNVEFLERVFMKSATTYKAAVYSGSSFAKDFWKGKADDKQLANSDRYIADYWIREFLRSDFLTPGQAGTRRFALAVRNTINQSSEPSVKADIAAIQHLMKNMRKQVISPKRILDRFNVADVTRDEIRSHYQGVGTFDDNFTFVPDEFSKHLAVQTIEIDNGAQLSAPTDKFEEIFETEVVNGSTGIVRISTQGRIVDRRLRKGRK